MAMSMEERVRKMQAAKAAKGLNSLKREKRQAVPITARQSETLEGVRRQASAFVKVFQKAYSGMSPAAGIKAKCLECCCVQRGEVERCAIEGCPLWRYRPYRAAIGVQVP